jgi:tetratricopeptide (TPR) repeat protein
MGFSGTTSFWPRRRGGVACALACVQACVLLILAACRVGAAECAGPADLEAGIRARATAEGYSQLGRWFADRKQFGCAADAFSAAFKMEPNSASVTYLWGVSLYSAGRSEEAVSALRRAEELDPGNVHVHLALGEALDTGKNTDEAESEWRAALTLDPGSTAALDHLAQDLIAQQDYRGVVALLDGPARGAAGSTPNRSAVECLDLGIALAGTGRFEDAAVVLRKGMDAFPDSMPVADELATVLMFLARADDAYAVLERALERHPDDEATQLLYMRILVARNSDKAQALGQKLLAEYPEQWEVLYLNGLMELHEGDAKTARAHLERSIALNPGDGEGYAALGNTLAQLGDLAGARRSLEKAIATGDREPEVEFDLARVLERLGLTAEAQSALGVYQQMKKAQTDRAQAAGEVESGDQAIAAGDPARAAALYRQAAGTDPEEALIFYKLGMALDKTKDVDGEKTALEEAIRLKPDFAEAQNQMGYLAVRAGDAAGAEGYLRAAVKASPSFVVAWVNLAAALTAEGKWADAREALKSAQALDPSNASARQLGQLLAQEPAQEPVQ